MEHTLPVGLSLSLITAVAFLVVAASVRYRRRRDGDLGGALAGLMLFWVAMALAFLTDAVVTAMAIAQHGPLWAVQTALEVRILTTLFAAVSLLHYLLTLFTGRSHLGKLALGYGTVFVALTLGANWLTVTGVDVQTWRGWFAFAHTTQTLAYYVVISLLWMPVILGTIAYLSLVRRVHGSGARFRVWTVGSGLLGLFLATYVGFLEFDAHWWGLVRGLVGLSAASLVLTGMLRGESHGFRETARRWRLRTLAHVHGRRARKPRSSGSR